MCCVKGKVKNLAWKRTKGFARGDEEPSVYGTAPAVPRACSIREVYVCGKDGLEVYVCVYFARRQTRAML